MRYDAACKEMSGMAREHPHAVKLEIPTVSKKNLRHTVDYYRKISYHRGLVLEGVRLCAMRNRGYWHAVYSELLQEKRRPVKPEEVEDRIRTLQREGGVATYNEIMREYNNKRLAAGLSAVKDGGPFGVARELTSIMEKRLATSILWFSWEIYMCLLYVEIEAYRTHTKRLPELRNDVIEQYFGANQGILEALKDYRDKVLHPQARVGEDQAIDRFFELTENSANNEIELVFTIQRMLDCHIQCVALGIIKTIDTELATLQELYKSGQRPRLRGHEKYGVWINRLRYRAPNVNLMTPQEFAGNVKKGVAPNLSLTCVIPLISRMMKHEIEIDGTTLGDPEQSENAGYVRMLMRSFILTSEGMGNVDTAKLLRADDPRTLPMSEICKLVKDGAEPRTLEDFQNLLALERVALAMIREPLRTYQKLVQRRELHVPTSMAQSIPTGEAYRKLCNYRNIVFHVKVGNYSPDKVERDWLQYIEEFPTIDIIHGLLAFYASRKGLGEVRAGATGDPGV